MATGFPVERIAFDILCGWALLRHTGENLPDGRSWALVMPLGSRILPFASHIRSMMRYQHKRSTHHSHEWTVITLRGNMTNSLWAADRMRKQGK